jgi:hypothetical protein
MSRPRDLGWEALVEVTGATVSSERGALNASLSQIREASDELTDEELADEIRHRAGVYRKTFPGMALTPTALAKHWERIPLEAPKPTYPEPSPAGECATCGGDKLVVYSTRPAPEGNTDHVHVYEEFAPCPDCNSGASVGFWRGDGSRFNPPDPAQVRRRIQG